MLNYIRENRRALIAATPIVGVNGTAFTGQFSYMRDHIHTWPLPGIVMLALTLESVAVYLAYEAHTALVKGDSAFALRMASYLFGAIIGVLNYSHYAGAGFRPTFLAVATGLMSVSSAPLWAVYSRRVGREKLLDQGIIEKRAVKFSRVRWMMWPVQTFKAFRLAAWTGEQNPKQAIADYERAEDNKRTVREAEEIAKAAEVTLETAKSQAEAIRVAIAELGESASTDEIIQYLAKAEPKSWSVTSARVRQVRAAMNRAIAAHPARNLRALPGAGERESG